MNKTIIYIILVIGGFSVSFFIIYQSYNNVELSEEELALSVSYLGNITKIESVSIDLDFVNEKMEFESIFYPNENSITLDSNSKGFQKTDGLCDDHFFIEYNDGSGSGGTWHDKKTIELLNFENIKHIEVTKTCSFFEPLVPNGKYIMHLYGNDFSGIIVDSIPVSISFNADKFRCVDSCVYSKQFPIIDQFTKHGITTILLEGKNVDTKRMDFDIRTIGIDAEMLSNLITIFIQVGIGAVITLILFIISNRQQEKIRNAILEIQKIGNKQQKIIEEQNNRNLKKKKTGEFFITHTCQMITFQTIILFNNFQKYLNKEIAKEEWEQQLENWKYGRDLAINHLENHHGIYSDVINYNTNLWLFELVESLKMFSKPTFESEAANVLIWGLFNAIVAVGKTLTSNKLKQDLDENEELQKIIAVGKKEMKSFTDSPKFDEMLDLMKLSKGGMKKLKNDLKKLYDSKK